NEDAKKLLENCINDKDPRVQLETRKYIGESNTLDLLVIKQKGNTTGLHRHQKACKKKKVQKIQRQTVMEKYITTVSEDAKKELSEAAALAISVEMRPISFVYSDPMKYLLQTAINIGVQYGALDINNRPLMTLHIRDIAQITRLEVSK
ncbi:hypothetical protein B4U80_14691, partial [Leptotrombidium deliense]